MSNQNSIVQTAENLDDPAQATSGCPVCPHPWADHDPIGRRYCTAKIAGGSSSGCVCRTAGQAGTPAHRPSPS